MSKHKGFTLMEMLIVMMVIGVLSSMMMLSTTESTSTARANNIVSNLRILSIAGLKLYSASGDVNKDGDITDKVKPYMHNEGNFPDSTSYKVMNNSGIWWAKYAPSDTWSATDRVKQKLAARASGAGLIGDRKKNYPEKDGTTYLPFDADSDSAVWLLIRP